MSSRIRKILVTGGAGFIGSEFVQQAVQKGYRLILVDKLTYAGDLQRLKEIKRKFPFYKTDIAHKPSLDKIFSQHKPTIIVNFAAETHVDRSIMDVGPFIQTNVIGVQNLIDLTRKYHVQKFTHISTDEIYGENRSGQFVEHFPLKPNNPYSATKASAELLLKAAMRTYSLPAVIIRPANNYGPWQYPEKFIPVIIVKALRNEKIPVYGKGAQIREWLYRSDCVRGILTIINKGQLGETYNIGSNHESNNLSTAKQILKLLKKPDSLIEFVKDRPGHDFRYGVDYSKLSKLGWKPEVDFNQGIQETVDWYIDHFEWLEKKVKYLKTYWKKVYKKS